MYVQEVAEYFANYILNDSLGVISNAHTVFADKEPFKAMSEQCIELAKLSSIAVDFPKTGVPAKVPHHLRVHEFPDFMEKPDKFTYESQSVIGRLYREVKAIEMEVSTVKHFTREVAKRYYDSDMEFEGFEAYVDDALHCKKLYDNKLSSLMRKNGVKTEAEMITGCIIKVSKSFNRKTDSDSINQEVKQLRKDAKSWFNEKRSNSELNSSNFDHVFAKASAWYHVTYHPKFWGSYNDGSVDQEHFISFPWCIYDKLLQIKKEKIRENSSQDSKSLEIRKNDDGGRVGEIKKSGGGGGGGGFNSDEKSSRWSRCSFM